MASELVEVEVARAARRSGPVAERRVAGALAGVSLVPIDEGVRGVAARVEPLTLRALDAIHLATALVVDGLDDLIAYDRRLVGAAREYGMEVLSPA